jgi:hypothetical protein
LGEMGLAMIVYISNENFWNTKMLKWPWWKQANESSNHFMYTNACKQAFVLVCVYLEVNSFNLQNYGKIEWRGKIEIKVLHL